MVVKMISLETKKARAQSELAELFIRKEKLEGQINEKENLIIQYDVMIKQKRFSAVEDVLHAKGLSLEDIISAIQNGDLMSLQDKIENVS